MIIKVKIADSTAGNAWIERQNYIDVTSLSKSEVLTSSPDSLKFNIKKYGNKSYTPLLGEEVKLEIDSINSFAGYIVDIDQSAESLKNTIKVTCKDYTHIMDRVLVSKIYENMTANDIIADLLSNYAPAGFTGTNVVAPVTIAKIVFNYMSLSQVFSKISTVLGVYDWYVDADKDIHFFQRGSISAPFEINDNGGNFVYSSLSIKRNSTQIKNKIIIRGGTVEGDIFTDKRLPNGEERTLFIGYNLVSISVKQSTDANVHGTYVTLTVGVDGKDNEDSFDCLYNSDTGLLRFRSNNIPPSNRWIEFSGKPTYPLITQKSDLTSISKYGTFEFVIVDKSIKSKSAASQRATAELLKFSVPQATINFTTTKNGLSTGQYIRVNSTGHNIIDEYFKIVTVTAKMRTPDTFTYQIEASLTENSDLVDLLKKMLLDSQSDKIDISPNEIVDRLYSNFENIKLSENYIASKVHNPKTETVNSTEVISVAKSVPTIFVFGDWLPTNEYIIDKFLESNYDISHDLKSGTNLYRGQSFSVVESDILNSSSFYIKKTGSPAGNVQIEIYNHTGTFGVNGKPGDGSSPIAVSNTISANTMPSTFSLVNFIFTASNKIILAENTKYIAIVKYTSGDASNYISIGGDISSPTATGNRSFSLNGTTWSSDNIVDHIFYIYTKDGRKQFILDGSLLA